MMSVPATVSIEPMTRHDLVAVFEIDRRCSLTPWLLSAFAVELSNRIATYFVARLGGQVVGFGGMQTTMDRVNLTTLGVEPAYRRRKIGERLLIALLEESIYRRATHVILEVRESNRAAQGLYKKYGFVATAIRKGYYTDTGENAVVMWVNDLQGAAFQQQLRLRGAELSPGSE